ncbi:Ribosomal RNA processing protein 1-like B [Acipenser ruthenus]|uniref:Ribosomal RNA processing protein 1-like B n=1 Tax=Acipenser ruthenus TaxID=7906 RepID=A0A444UYN2_ACIRT|nr:Ribosomal RNA processing protein 1-like B [Acipenser ruthenus]
MAPMLQSPEIQFAQRLASNEKPVRTRAIKKLRKYLSIRSQKPTGGFSNDELLKIWKGLFYCMWMQDKPLLQLKGSYTCAFTEMMYQFCGYRSQKHNDRFYKQRIQSHVHYFNLL